MTSIGDKVQHVKRARQTRLHACHWPGCTKQVPPAMWGCRPHWFALPKQLRDRIWRAYRPGQENDLKPSATYIEVALEVRAWIRDHEAKKLKATASPYDLSGLKEFPGD